MSTNNATHSHNHDAHSLCWACREEAGSGPFCKNCVKIQPVEEFGNYYTLFDLEPTFRVSAAELKRNFYKMSRKFHPDYYSSKSPEEQTFARNNTAYLNTALQVLSDPILRAEYLLSLVAGSFSSSPTPPRELFEEILEIGELLLDAKTLSPEDEKKLAEVETNFASRQRELIESLDELFLNLLDGDKSAKDEIVMRLNNIKYLRTVLKRIQNTRNGDNGHD